MGLRLARLADIEAMHAVRLAVRENRLSDPAKVTPEHYRAMLQEHGRGWVHEIDGKVVAFAVGDHRRRNIWALFVAPGFEGRGIGRALHERMVQWLFSRSAEPLWLCTEPNTRAERFYAKAGWQTRGAGRNGEVRFELSCANEFSA
jgi:GNAT superfamily N-acetyltransferase